MKTFKGKLADGEIARIRLGTNDGKTGYMIRKFQALPETPGSASSNHVLQIFANEPSTTSGTVDMDNPQLLAVSWMRDNIDANYAGAISTIIVDNKKINQDIFLTHVETVSTEECNYYIELEMMKLDLNEATVATLKDMRGRE